MLCMLCFCDVGGDLVDGVACVFEFEVNRFAVMTAMILQGLHEVFWEVGSLGSALDRSVVAGVAVFLDLAEFFEQEFVVVFGCDDEGLSVEPCCGPGKSSQELPAIPMEG